MPSLPEPKGKQKQVLALPAEGHCVVLGTAGSGKTTMAIHRAALLANPQHSRHGPVLLVTFNRTLLAYLRYWRPDNLQGVSFENFHTFARGYLGSIGRMGNGWICKDDAARARYVAQAVENVKRRTNGREAALFSHPLQWFCEEIRFIDRYGLQDAEYIQSDRFGRGTGLNRDLRPKMLEVLHEYRLVRQAAGQHYDWDDMARAVFEGLQGDTRTRKYRHVVIDEGQDFSPAMLRALALAVPSDGSLTFFGDMAQQIYGRQVSWKRAGLHVPDGAWKFKRNYRNTPEIAALGLAIARMPYFRDVADMVEPDEFEPSGPLPALVRCASVADETQWVIARARDAARTGSVGVLMHRHEDEARFRRAFRGAQRLHRDMETWNPGPGISYGTVHAAKGYEFNTVILIGASADSWPEPVAVANEGEEAATAGDGRLLYVAVTRAKRELILTYTGKPTALLPGGPGLWREEQVG